MVRTQKKKSACAKKPVFNNLSLISSIGCDSECNSETKTNGLCGSTTMSECPTVKHTKIKHKKTKKESSSCSESSSCDWSAILCKSASRSYSCSDTETETKCETQTVEESCGDCKSVKDKCKCKKTEMKVKYTKCVKCCYTVERCKCACDGKNVVKGRVYNVAFVPKAGHPQVNRIWDSSECISIDANDGNGYKKGRDLHLTMGNTYRFNITEVSTDGNTFYFTADSQGGVAGKSDPTSFVPVKLAGTPDAISSGYMTIKIDESYPKSFYYQSSKHSCLGGNVFIHSKTKC